MREKAAAQSADASKSPRKLRQATSTAKESAGAITKKAKREYYLPMPDNRVGRFLNKRRRFVPKYFREAWVEVRQVTWPTRREALKLTGAVIIFTVVFALVITGVDYVIGNVFRKVFLNS